VFGFIRRILGIPQRIEITVNVPTIQVTIQQQEDGPSPKASCGSEYRSGTPDKQSERQFLVVPKASPDEEICEKEFVNKFSNTRSAVGKFGQDENK
jgi:hypothetical protein